MTTATATATKATNNYPFFTKAQIKDRLATDDAFVVQCVLIMHSRQTEGEQAAKTTKDRNKRGWMSSHAVRGSTLAQKLLQGEKLSTEELGKAREIVGSYSKQLAGALREEALRAKPELRAIASVFGVATVVADPVVEAPVAEPVAEPEPETGRPESCPCVECSSQDDAPPSGEPCGEPPQGEGASCPF